VFHHDGGARRHAGLLLDDQPHGLLAVARLRAEPGRGQAVQGHAPRAIDHGGRQIVEPQTDDPPGELTAE
jgi:hypothetical protein